MTFQHKQKIKFDKHPKRRGQSLAEFALVVPVFLLLLFGLFEGGRAFYQWHLQYRAALQGARQAAMAAEADIEAIFGLFNRRDVNHGRQDGERRRENDGTFP